MSDRNITTRFHLEHNGTGFPCVTIKWTECADKLGWEGVVQYWENGITKTGKEHSVTLRQAMPLGTISVVFDECVGGAWKFASFEGARLDERDLQWVTLWAAAVLENWKKAHESQG